MDSARRSKLPLGRHLVTVAMLVLAASMSLHAFSMPVADNDLWGHLFFGQKILDGGLPGRNLYSYTAPEHPWINHEIVAECVFAWVYDRLGSAGLLGLKLLMGVATLAVMLLTTRRRASEPLAWGPALALAASLMSYGYLIRPQLFTFLALAVLWELLHRCARGQRRALWVLPVLFAVWVNSHGGVIAGVAVLAVFATLHAATYRANGSQRLELGAIVAASLLALLLNPYGPELPRFLVEDLLRHRPITEWSSIPLLDFSNFQFKVAVSLFVAGVFLARGRSVWEVVIIGLVAIATFRHERHLPIFAILSTPFLALTLQRVIRGLERRAGTVDLSLGAAVTLSVGIIVISTLQTAATIRIHRDVSFGIFVSPEQFPVEAIRFIRQNRLSGNLAVPFGWGEYAIWHLYPDCRVSIDGRYTTAYPDDVIEASWRYLDGAPGLNQLLDEATLALADRRHSTPQQLLSDPRWQPIHTDDTALLFARVDTNLPRNLMTPVTDPRRATLFP